MTGNLLWTNNHQLYEEINVFLRDYMAVNTKNERSKIRRLFGYKLMYRDYLQQMGFKERMKIHNLIQVYQ